MSSPYLGIPHIAANQTQKEVTANDGTDRQDSALNANVSIAVADANPAATLTQAQTASGLVLVFTGALTADRNVIVPAIARVFAVKNSTTDAGSPPGAAYKLTVKTSSGTGIAVAAADGYVLLYCDGTNVVGLGVTAGGSVPRFADAEVPSGTINGTNTAFTLANSPNPAASLMLVLNGVVQKAGGVDYTLSGATITYVTAPPTGDSHVCWYRY